MTDSTHRISSGYLMALVLAAITISIVAMVLVRSRDGRESTAPSGTRLNQSPYSVTLENDTAASIDVVAFALDHFNNTQQGVTAIASGQTAVISLASGYPVYVFRASLQTDEGQATHDSVMSAQRLIDRSFYVKLIEDDQQFSALPTEMIPVIPTMDPWLPTPTP